MLCHVRFSTCLTLLLISISNTAQQVVTDTSTYKTVVADASFMRPAFYQRLWGRNHRIEWATPVRVPVLWLNRVEGGIAPYKTGGGNETKSLRLRSAAGKEYALRTINKSREDVVPEAVKGTFLEDIVNDGISMSHPYGAFALPVMQQHAGIYHTLPKLVYVPRQAALDTFNAVYGDKLYLFEQKPDGDWREADNLGNFASFLSTEELIEKLKEDNNTRADQHQYIKSRLFDMLIGDWDRHEGNWSWGVKDSNNTIWYIPVPRDRDQSFYEHDGFLIDRMMRAAKVAYMQNFDHRVKNIEVLNYETRNIDRFFTNALTLTDWINAAKYLHDVLTDTVIAQSVRQLPPEVFAVAGKEMIEKLKSRREQLERFATEYYMFIAPQVEVVGSKKQEYFEVYTTGNGETVVAVYRINKAGRKENSPWYQRTFNARETNEVRLFGIGGNDVYNVSDHSPDITIRIIGGPGKDSVLQKGHTTHVYDDADNIFNTTSASKHISSDTSIHKWNYAWFNYDKKGFMPIVYYSREDRIYAGIHYRYRKYKWRREPFASQYTAALHYSISQNALSASIGALYPNAIGRWNLGLKAEYDVVRWINFFGNGNETKFLTRDLNYNRMRTEEWFAGANLYRQLGKSTVGVQAYYQRVRSRNDTDGFISKVFSANPAVFLPVQYGTLQLTYSYVTVNDSILPVKGFSFIVNGALSNNFTEKKLFQKYEARMQAWFPFTKHLSFAIRAGGETIVNDDVLINGRFYQHATIGGPKNLRAYRRDRFWGRTAFYNSNELRFITPLHTRIMNGRIGVVGFFDQGRVWMPGEQSNKMHISYGPGFILSPFNKFSVTCTYGISEEIQLFQIRFDTLL